MLCMCNDGCRLTNDDWPRQSRTALALASPASGELTLETAPVVRSDCDLTPRATGHKEWPAAALLAPFGAVSD